MRKRLHIAGATLTAIGLLALTGSTQAYSAPIDPVTDSGRQAAAPANSVLSGSIKDGEVKANDIGNQQIFGKHFSPAMISWFTTTWNNSVDTVQLKNGAVTMQKIDPLVQRRIEMPTQYGQWGALPDPVVLENTGGSILGNYNLPPNPAAGGDRKGTLLPGVAGLNISPHAPDTWGVALMHTISVYAEFEYTAEPANPAVQVQPQISLWADYNGDKIFTANEELASPNVTLISKSGRHGSVNASIPALNFENQTAQSLQIYAVAHAYASDDSSANEGIIRLNQLRISDTLNH